MQKKIKIILLFLFLLLGSFCYAQEIPKTIFVKETIANKTPLPNLGKNEVFTAGDFEITVLERTGTNGIFSGKGFMVVPYLADTKIAVEFNDIKINSSYQMYDGFVFTTYDKTWGNVVDVQPTIDAVSDLIGDLIHSIRDAIKEQIDNGTITKEEAEELTKEVDAQEILQQKATEEIKQIEKEIADAKKDNKDAEASEEQKKTIETNKIAQQGAVDKLQEIASDLKVKAGKGNRVEDTYFNGLLPLAGAGVETFKIKKIDGGELTFKNIDAVFETYSTTISGKKYTFVITTSNSTEEQLKQAKNLVNNPTDGIVIYNHYDLVNKKLGYKVNFAGNYYNNPKQYNQEAINALFVFALNNKLDDAKNISDWGSKIFEITSKIDTVFQEVINKAESTWFTSEGITKLKEVFDFLQKCKTDYAQQKEGYIPRCLWDHNQNVPYITDMAFSAGFTDGLIETVVGVFQLANFASCWDFTKPSFFSADCAETRDKTQKVLQLVYTTFSDYNQFSTATSGAWSGIKGYADETTKLDNQARYNQGKIVFNVASLFIGAGEAKAILKGETTLTAVLKESLLAYKNLPKSISKLVLNSSKNIVAKAQKGVAEIYLFYKLNNTELKLGKVLDQTFQPEHWLTIGNKLETIENCAYLGKDGKIVTGTIEVVEKDGVIGGRVLDDAENILQKYRVAIFDKVKIITKDKTLPSQVIETFRDSYYYTAEVLENISVFRRFGGNANQAKLFGGFASTEAVLSRNDLAILKEWSTMQFEAEMIVEKGTKVNLGKIESQLGYTGGADQVLLPQNYPETWVKNIKDLKTGKTYNVDEFKIAFPDLIYKK